MEDVRHPDIGVESAMAWRRWIHRHDERLGRTRMGGTSSPGASRPAAT